jgi:hypothetical protein
MACPWGRYRKQAQGSVELSCHKTHETQGVWQASPRQKHICENLQQEKSAPLAATGLTVKCGQMSPQSQLCPDIVLSDSRAVSQRVIKLKCLCIFPGGRSGRGVMSHSFQMGNMAIIATAGSKTEFWTVYHQAA